MILPIATLFGRPGNPGSGGVPALTIDPSTGAIIGAGFDSPTAIQQLEAQPATEPWSGENGCKADARDLREFADQAMKHGGPGPILAEDELIGVKVIGYCPKVTGI